MSATPEQIAERLEALAQNEAECGFMTEAYDIRQAASFIRAQAERVRVLALALRRLTYWAQTSGGTAGRDDGLVAAIDVAVEALREHDAALKAAP